MNTAHPLPTAPERSPQTDGGSSTARPRPRDQLDSPPPTKKTTKAPPGSDPRPPAGTNVVALNARSLMQAAPTDAELLDRCRAGDAEAWDLLVARYERLVYSVAIRNGVPAEDAADITQTTFVALIDSLNRIKDDTKLASWLMTVARRQAWRLRSLSRQTLVTDSVPEQAEDPFADWAVQTAVHDGLSQLSGTCRDLLLALFFDPEEPSYAEIAERFGRSIGGIGPLRGRCLERLRVIMDAMEGA